MTRDISSSADIIDLRDVTERFEELESERQDIADDENAEATALSEWDEENGEEFKQLQALLSELEGNGGDHDWRGSWYPLTLIRDSYFVDAMQEMVEDCWSMPKDLPSFVEIDWEKTADNLRADYSSIEYDGVTYWYR